MSFPTILYLLILLFLRTYSVKGLPSNDSYLRGSSDLYSHVQNDMKCPFNSNTRLFRTPGLTLNDCSLLCYNTHECHYFSFGVTSYKGLCIGCTEDASLSPENGLVAYELNETRDDFPTASPIAASSCLTDTDMFTTKGCDYESVLYGLNKFLIENKCGDYDANAVLDSLFPNASEDEVTNICATAWGGVPTSTFKDVDDRFDNDFMEEYIDGDTFLNTQTGTFQGTGEGKNIASFRNAQATNSVVESIPSMSTCANNAIMCCFGRDRQPNDNNGNCKDPIATNCRHADPADNSNLCWTDTDIPTFDAPFTFAGKSEGPIHCHGLAWGDDENSFEAQLRFNNFFFVSLYDHMYTRGYVETTVDSDNIGMCDCVENMPVVSRADCTEIDAIQTFQFTYNNGSFTATKEGAMAVNFNACKGTNPGNGRPKDNDLGSYVFRLNENGKISDEKLDGVFETLVGYENPNDNQNEAACESAYLETFGELYIEETAGLKCPFQDTERLFRTQDNDPLSLEECQDLCYDTQFCEYFSLGISERGDTYGVCIGCTANAVLEADRGFNSYQMTSKFPFPTMSPTPESEYFDAIATNKKCPFNQDRLFRTDDNDPLTRQECYEKCYDTEGCEYFTLAENPLKENHAGICIGCIAESVLEDESGFNSYVMEIKQDFSTSAPTVDHPEDVYELVGSNRKCPYNSNRLFRTPDYNPLTKFECFQMCNNTPNCKYFTFGEEVRHNKHKGLCMGCTDGVTLSKHKGFNSYAIIP